MKGIIFDLDGTLVDSMSMYRNLSKTYLRQFNIELDEDLANKLTVMNLKASIECLINYYKLNKQVDEVYEGYLNLIIDFYSNKVEFKDRAEEILNYYLDKDYVLALGTATQRNLLKYVFERLKLKQYFQYVQSVEDVAIAKSDEGFFNALASKMKLANNEIMVFDDAPYALEAAKRAGMMTTAVYDETIKNNWQDMKQKNDFYITNFGDVLKR